LNKKANASDGQLVFLPLGGSGEIGMNLNLYGIGEQWIMVDFGMSFADDHFPGVDLILPDISFLEERLEMLKGIILTHAHEDHIGAIPYLWARLRVPMYATPFTAHLIRKKLAEVGLENEAVIHEIAIGGSFDIEPFKITYVPLPHSIAEGNALKIETPHGTVFHTGDWKLDNSPQIGMPVCEDTLRQIGVDGVLAMVGDSTNAFSTKSAGSEQDVYENMLDLVKGLKNRVVISTFASNIARVQTIGRIASATGRHLTMFGRSLHRVTEAAKETGYLKDFPDILDEDEVMNLPRDKVLIMSTGCQGEPRAALSRIAEGKFKNFSLAADDHVLFSSKIIPGNEISIGRLINNLVEMGVDVITEHDAFIHVSGHPGQPDLKQMYGWIKPQMAVPVHGEIRHMTKHAKLAKSWGVEKTLVPKNGDIIRLAPDGPLKIDQAPFGKLLVDGSCIIPAYGEVMAERRRLLHHGHLVVAIGLDADGIMVSEAECIAYGIPGWQIGGALEDKALDIIDDVLEKLPHNKLKDDAVVAEAIRRGVRQMLSQEIGKKPIVQVSVLRDYSD
jgi:ribonuclease J